MNYLYFFKKAYYIISIRINQQCKKDDHSNDLCIFQEFFTGFSAGDDFIKEEGNMAAVECWDGQDIHNGQDKGKESGHVPE